MSTVTVDARFCGPPDSANGGYVAGLAAEALGAGPAEVTLRRPPPLDRPLEVVRTDDGIELRDGDATVVQARPTDQAFEVPAPVTPDLAATITQQFDHEGYRAAHPFPRCFACGPARPEGDGLRLFPARTGRSDVIVAWPWRPDDSLAGEDGLVSLAALWAALDCPSGGAWWFDPADAVDPAVLGRMAGVVHRRPAPGEDLVAGGWRGEADGRRLSAGSAIWAADGEVLATARTTWIVLSPEQLATFGGT